MYRLLFDKFSTHHSRSSLPSFDSFSLYKIKTDLKETGFSPYSRKFNQDVLREKKNLLDPKKEHFNELAQKFGAEALMKQHSLAFKQYLLPDGKTTITIDIGDTDKEVTDQLIKLYFNS